MALTLMCRWLKMQEVLQIVTPPPRIDRNIVLWRSGRKEKNSLISVYCIFMSAQRKRSIVERKLLYLR